MSTALDADADYMGFRILRAKFLAFLVLAVPCCLQAQQQRPSPDQVQSLLLAQPDLAGRLQSMIQSSGMSPEQIRSRLRSEGFSESVLDQYLSGARSDSAGPPDEEVFAAIRSLGVRDTVGLDSLRSVARASRRGESKLDSMFVDTLLKASRDDSTRAAIRRLIRSRSAIRAQADSGFEPFGYDLFANETSQFDPNVSGAVDAGYRLGPGDQLLVLLSGDAEKRYPLDITREGFVFIPDIGQVSVSNLTLSQFEDLLYERLGRIYSGLRRGPGATTRMAITLARTGTNQIFVTGDVKRPGSYRVSRAATALSALYAAGGPSETGTLRNIVIRRANQPVGNLDVYSYLLAGDASRDIRLENGDVVFVPPHTERVRITGAVLRPATYEVVSGETLADLLRMAGGLSPTADRRRIQIERILPPAQRASAGTDRRTIDIASGLLLTGGGPPEPLSAGDIVHVFEIPRRVSNRVQVKGNVWTPGAVAIVKGTRLSDALRRAGGLKPDSYLGEVLITRPLPDSSRMIIRSALRDTTGVAVNDVEVRDGDEITVFSIAEFRPNTYVTIGGAVRRPGRFAYRQGMTLHDLVLLAGGLEESALLNTAEIARLPENRAPGVTAVTERVALDSSYVFGRGPDGSFFGAPGVPAAMTVAPEVNLRPYDAVLILEQPDWQLHRTVAIRGEVRYPGQYALTKKTERLTDLITRAGGLTDRAYPDGIVFIRRKDDIGRIGLDLPEALRSPKDVDNIELVDGDSIVIPTLSPVVTLKGAVNSPVAVAYVPGADIDYYVRAAGGANAKADIKKAYVSQPNGKVETRQRRAHLWTVDPKPQPGSTVFVPERDLTEKLDFAAVSAFMATTASIIGSIVAIVAITHR